MRRSKPTRLRRPPFESLEPRTLLAGDLVAQWRAHDLIGTIEDGEPITAWLDSVSNLQAEAGGNPLLNAAAIGGRAAVRFDPSDRRDWFTISAADNPVSNAEDFSIAVLFATSTTDLQGGLDDWHNATGLVHSNRLGFAQDWGITLNSDGIPATGLGGGFGEPSTSLFGNHPVNDGQPHLIVVSRSGGNLAIYVDETEPLTASGPNSEPRNQLTAEFGLSHIHEGALDAEIAEVRFYDGALTEAEARGLYEHIMAFYVNELPVAVADSYRVAEDDLLLPGASNGLLANDFDADGDLLTARLISTPIHGELGLRPDGSFIYAPERNFFGTDTFTYSAVDFRTSEPVTVTIEVTPTYDAPVGRPDEYKTSPGQVLTIPDLAGVLANDINVDGHLLTALLGTPPVFGDVELAAGGGFTFDPQSSSGITTFTYRMDDGFALSAETLVTLVVNSAPLATNDTYQLSEDNVLRADADSGVLANDFDAEFDTLSVTLSADAQNGQLTLSTDGSFVYEPTPDFFGSDAFSYWITDGIETSAEATVELLVAPVNDLPVAAGDAYFVATNQQLAVPVGRGVLANDLDVEPSLLSATLVTETSNGQLSLVSDGSFVYRPSPNFFGEDTFSYEVRDADGGRALGQVRIFVGMAPIRINEFMAANATTLLTRTRLTPDDRFPRDAVSPDWVELTNQTELPIDITGFHLTDDSSELAAWAFPSGTTIPAMGYLVVFLSGVGVTDARLDEAGLLHADFKLDAKGDALLLTSPEGTVVDSISGPFPEQIADVSYGLTRSGFMYLPLPTPGAANSSEALPGIARATDVSIPAGYYDAPVRVELTSATPDSTIRYTLDGSEPTEADGTEYDGPIDIQRTTLLRTRVFRDGLLPSASVTYSYLYLNDVLTQPKRPEGFPSTWGRAGGADYEMDPRIATDEASPYYDPNLRAALQSHDAISIVTDMDHLFDRDTGIYSNPQNEGPAWERPASMELISAEGSSQFQINAGLRIQGGASRNPNRPKHNLRFLFKETYGESKLAFPFFPDSTVNTFDTLILRGGNGDSWFHPNANQQNQAQYIRDQWHKQTQQLLGHTFVPQRYIHLFINGLYWGFYHAYEKPNAAFFAERFGGEPEEYDVLQHKNGVVDGTRDTWNAIMSVARDGLESEAALEYIKQEVDISAFIEYMLLNFYSGNVDWDQNNWFGGRKREDGKFIFFTWDAERTFLSPTDNRTTVRNASQPSDLHRRLRENDEYRMLFADIAHRHLFHGGLLTPESAAGRWQALADEIMLPLVAESARWGDNKRSSRPYTRDVEWQRELDRLMTGYFPGRTDTVLRQLRQQGFYPETTAPTFHQHGGVFDAGFELTMSAPDGTIYYTTDGSDPRLAGNDLSATAIEYTQGVALSIDTTVKARVLLNGEWSALNQANFLAPSVAASAGSLRVSEISYHPSPLTDHEITAGFQDPNDFEFVELVNISGQTIDLSAVQLVREDGGGVDFDFASAQIHRLAPGDRLVVVEDTRAFAFRYGTGIPIAGQWSGRLSNGGEMITVVAGDELIQQFVYDDAWHPTTDGDGHTLEIVDPAADDPMAWSRATGWQASIRAGGTPGRGPDAYLPGDSNHDGIFNSSDLVLVFQVGEYEDGIVGNSTFEDGDWNDDGDFSSQDLVFVFQLGTYAAQARANSLTDTQTDLGAADAACERSLRPAARTIQDHMATVGMTRRRRLHIPSIDAVFGRPDLDGSTDGSVTDASFKILEDEDLSVGWLGSMNHLHFR